jgi:ketopantoate reductase
MRPVAEIWVRTENAGAYKSSTVLDLVAGNPLEMRYLFGVPLERAR